MCVCMCVCARVLVHAYRVLKSMEFPGAIEGAEETGKGRSLEVLLLEKNKTLQNENTQLKLSNTDLSGRYT